MLQDLILTAADKREIPLKQIALSVGASQAAISNFLRGKTEINFYTALKIIRYLFPDKEKELMTNYIKEINKPENIRLAMEYASIQDMLDLLYWLVVTQQNSHNALNREWAKVYELEYKFKKGDVKPHELVEQNRFLRLSAQEMMFMQKWFDFFYYTKYVKDYGVMKYVSHNMELYLSDLDDPFLQKCFSTRFYFTVVSRYLYGDELDIARHYAKLVIENDISFDYSARMHHLLGLSYYYENFDKALYHLHKAKQIFADLNLEKEFLNIDKSIYFVSNYWNKDIAPTDGITDPGYLQEVAHQKIKKGDLHGANSILTQIDCNSLTVQGRAFQLYYLGICHNNTTLLYNSLTLFIQTGNKFFARLPYFELLRAGEKKEAVTAAYGELSKINICNLTI